MKQQAKIQTKTKIEIRTNIIKSLTGMYETTVHLRLKIHQSKISLVRNIGKDPPGWSLSRRVARILSPDNKPASLKNKKNLIYY